MTMKKLYIHIGFGKTGTTSIQSLMSKRQSELLEHGVLYPSVGQDGGHHLLAPIGLQNISGDLTDIYTELLKEIDDASVSTIVISSENFAFAQPSFIEDLKKKFQKYSIKIVFYVRDQVPLIESTYLEWQKVGNKYDENIRLFFLEHKLSFDFMIRIDPWAQNFGSENIIARFYDRKLINQNVCVDFFNVIGISGGIVEDKIVEENPSLRPEFSELVRLIDKIGPSKTERNMVIHYCPVV